MADCYREFSRGGNPIAPHPSAAILDLSDDRVVRVAAGRGTHRLRAVSQRFCVPGWGRNRGDASQAPSQVRVLP
jgi:hypothetical protein